MERSPSPNENNPEPNLSCSFVQKGSCSDTNCKIFSSCPETPTRLLNVFNNSI